VFEAVDIDGGSIELETKGLFARVLQHEIDHIDGILFVDRVSALKRRILMKKWKKIQSEED
jgi:peptide deformylase